MDSLKQCPFCGVDVTKGGNLDTHKKTCYFNSDASFPMQGLERWNIRPLEEDLLDKLHKAEERYIFLQKQIIRLDRQLRVADNALISLNDPTCYFSAETMHIAETALSEIRRIENEK